MINILVSKALYEHFSWNYSLTSSPQQFKKIFGLSFIKKRFARAVVRYLWDNFLGRMWGKFSEVEFLISLVFLKDNLHGYRFSWCGECFLWVIQRGQGYCGQFPEGKISCSSNFLLPLDLSNLSYKHERKFCQYNCIYTIIYTLIEQVV